MADLFRLDEITPRGVYWLEYVNGEGILAIGGSSCGGAHCFIDVIDRSLALKDADYNVTWRAWTAEPTIDQRSEARWNERLSELRG